MKIAAYGLLAVSLIAMAVATGATVTSDAESARHRSARKAVLIIAPFIVLGIAGILLT
ncbi:hypothetical protein ABZ918_28920 [Streptomyces viridosporus]|uniref:hypothetical protein n=1 Tax=Streptomyces viridosporus TaxID=67581 RepID=UPI003431319E